MSFLTKLMNTMRLDNDDDDHEGQQQLGGGRKEREV